MTHPAAQGQDDANMRSKGARAVLAVCAVLAIALFASLGTWQLFRLQWKLALIERVEQRVHAAPVAAPTKAEWPGITAENAEYRHVLLRGAYLYDKSVRVQAATALGSGWWLLTPMRMASGDTILVNRGFVPAGTPRDSDVAGEVGTAIVTGLLRMTEPGGGFLRRNDPSANRWYSRDVQAIAAAQGLDRVAPYFVDADAAAPAVRAPSVPVAGLTVVSFPNNHLAYAVTWYVLALMTAGAWYRIAREDRRRRLRVPDDNGETDSKAGSEADRDTWQATFTRRKTEAA
jgi:surfeit locus 1 family protein